MLYLLVLPATGLLFFVIWGLEEWYDFNSGCKVKISFRELMNYIRIAPEKWGTGRYALAYWGSGRHIGLTLFGYLQYVKWLKAKDRQREQKKINDELLAFLNSVQKDIDNYREKHIDTGIAKLKEMSEALGKEA